VAAAAAARSCRVRISSTTAHLTADSAPVVCFYSNDAYCID
jgi:hypothetical protein